MLQQQMRQTISLSWLQILDALTMRVRNGQVNFFKFVFNPKFIRVDYISYSLDCLRNLVTFVFQIIVKDQCLTENSNATIQELITMWFTTIIGWDEQNDLQNSNVWTFKIQSVLHSSFISHCNICFIKINVINLVENKFCIYSIWWMYENMFSLYVRVYLYFVLIYDEFFILW